MTPLEAAAATADAISGIGSLFMFDTDTYGRGAEIGLEGIDFYFVGRGGAIGDVDADVVAAGFVFFEPGTVRTAWERGTAAVPPGRAAGEWAEAAHRWGESNLPDEVHLARVGELAGRIVDAASPAGAPVFAGWRRLAVPTSPAALAIHHLNGLRELRNAMHGAAVLAAGLAPQEAVIVRAPHMIPLFGWTEPLPSPEAVRAQWDEAEAATDRAFARFLSVLDGTDLDDFVELVRAIHAAVT